MQFGDLIVEELLVFGIWENAEGRSSNCNDETGVCGDGVFFGLVNAY